MNTESTLLGTVEDVSGASIRVLLNDERSLGLAFVEGHGYRIGQVGTFVRIPIGYQDLFGLIAQVGASAAPDQEDLENTRGQRWLSVELVGEASRAGRLQRGLSQFPTVGDRVHLVTERELSRIYGRPDSPNYISLGSVVGSDAIPALIDINNLVTRHSAVVGSTGSGKSTTVASLIHQVSSNSNLPSPRVLLLDVHGEYAHSMRDIADVYTVAPSSYREEKGLYVPYWALTFEELLLVAFGGIQDDTNRGALAERVTSEKRIMANEWDRLSVDPESITADSPIPFSIHKLWFDLHCEVLATFLDTGSQSIGNIAYRRDEAGVAVDKGDPMAVRPPDTLPHDNSRDAEPKVYLSQSPLNLRRQIEGLRYRLRDPRYDFLFRPGRWLPDPESPPAADLDELLRDWLGGEEGVTILDLSGIPSDVLDTLVGALLRIVYDALFWAQRLPEGGKERPLLLVLEEAHGYIGSTAGGSAANSVRRIAKEGRKYGVGLMLVSQRPTEIDSTILSQCGTLISMRLTNSEDRGRITTAAADNFRGVFGMLPVLRTGEAIVTGEAVKIPTRTRVTLPPKQYLPDSQDPVLYSPVHPGGWNQAIVPEDYEEVVELWRRKDPTPKGVVRFEEDGNDE